MCIIAVKPKGIEMFPETTIREMFSRNPDGAGIMYSDGEKVLCKKGFMDVESLLEFLSEGDYINTDLVLHFRIGTSGKTDALNCHPYPVFEENAAEFETQLAVAHNGILQRYNPPIGSDYNDTQNFIKKILQKLPKNFVDDESYKLLVEEIISSGYTNKLCFLSKDKYYLWGQGWIQDGDYWYSNSSYKPYEKPVYSTSKFTTSYGSIFSDFGEDMDLFSWNKSFNLGEEDEKDEDEKEYDEWIQENFNTKEIHFDDEDEMNEFIRDKALYELGECYYADAYDNEYYFYPEQLLCEVYSAWN